MCWSRTKLRSINLRTCDAIKVKKKSGTYRATKLNIGSNAFKNAGVSHVKVKCGLSKCGYQCAFKKALKKKDLRCNARVVK